MCAAVSHGRGGAVPADPIVTLLTVAKTAVAVNGSGSVGDTIDYSIVVSNIGQTDVANIIVSDPKLPTMTPAGPHALDSGQNVTVTGTYTIVQADIDAGQVSNTATVTGTDSGGNPVGPFTSGPVVTTGLGPPPAPDVSLAKTFAVSGGGGVGDTITYTVVATNNGTGPATGIGITDPNVAALLPAGPQNIPAGGALTYTGTHVITQADVDGQSVSNSVTAQVPGQTPDPTAGPVLVNPPDLETANGQISVAKTAVVNGAGGVGDTITYTVTVRNTGNVTMSAIQVTDDKVTLAPAPPASLAPSAQHVSTGTYTITQADINGGGVVSNTVSAQGTDPQGNPRQATAGPINTNVAAPVSDLQLTKTAVSNGAGGVGDSITYTVTATNGGTIPLSGVTITDPSVTLTPAGPFNIAPNGGTQVVTGTYTLTQADLDAGQVQNTATANGQDPGGTPVGPVVAGPIATSTAAPNPSLSVAKTGTIAAPGGVGDTVSYVIDIANNGNQTLQAVAPTDAALGGLALDGPGSTGTPAALGVGQTLRYTGTRPITLADITAGSITNTVSVAFQNPAGVAQTPVTGSETLTAADGLQPPDTNAPVLTGCPTGTEVAVIGQPMTPIVITSNEPVTWQLDFAPAGVSITAQTPTSITISGTPTAAANTTMEVVATDPQGNNGICEIDFISEPIPTIDSGCPAGFTGWVQTVPIAPFTLAASAPGGTWSVLSALPPGGPPVPLAPLPAGVTLNTATGVVSGTPTAVQAAAISTAIVYTTAAGTQSTDICLFTWTAVAAPAVQIDKAIDLITSGPPPYSPGDTITYNIGLTNNGGTQLTNLVVTDPGSTIVGSPLASLNAASSDLVAMTATHTVTAAEATDPSGQFSNTATVVAQSPAGGGPVTDTATATAAVAGNAGLTVGKFISGASRGGVAVAEPYQPGDVLLYAVNITNNGDIDVTGINVTDPLLGALTAGGAALTPFTLAAGQASAPLIGSIEGTYTVTTADALTGTLVNTVTAAGTAVTGPVVATGQVTVTTEPPPASISLTKTVAASTPIDIDEIATPPGSLTPNPFPNDVMSYSPDVPVNITQIDVVLTNNSGGPLSPTLSIVGQSSGTVVATANPTAPLAAGATAVVSYPMNVDLQPATLGGYRLELSNTADLKFYTNTAGLGRPDLGYFSQGTAAVSPDPEIRIVGTFLNTAQPFAEGSTLVYVLTATNDGDQDLGNVVITDPLGAVAGGVAPVLTPGAQLVASVTHTVSNAEASAGVINNTATVDATATIGPDTPTDTASLSTQVAVPPTITNCPAAPLSPAGGVAITMTADRPVTWGWDDNPNSGLSLNTATGAISGTLNAVADGRVVRVTATDTTTGLTDICDITMALPAPELTLTNLRITEARNPAEWDTRNTFDGSQVGHTVSSPTFTAPFDMVLTRVQLFALLSTNGVATRFLEVRDGVGNNGTTLGVSTNNQPINGPNIKGLKTWNFDPIPLSAGQTVTFRANGLGPTAFWFVDPGNSEPQFGMTSGGGEFEGRVNGFEIDTTGPFTGPYGPGIQLGYTVDIENTGTESVNSVAIALASGETSTDAPATMTVGQTATATMTHTVTAAEGTAGSVVATAQGTATGDVSSVTGGPFLSNTVTVAALPAPILTGCPTGTITAINGTTYTAADPLLDLGANEAGTWGIISGPLGYSVNAAGQVIGTQFGTGTFPTIVEFTSAVSGLTARCSFTTDVIVPPPPRITNCLPAGQNQFMAAFANYTPSGRGFLKTYTVSEAGGTWSLEWTGTPVAGVTLDNNGNFGGTANVAAGTTSGYDIVYTVNGEEARCSQTLEIVTTHQDGNRQILATGIGLASNSLNDGSVRAFYDPTSSFNLRRIRMRLLPSQTVDYPNLSIQLRDGAFNGPVLATSQQTTAVGGDTEVVFVFDPPVPLSNLQRYYAGSILGGDTNGPQTTRQTSGNTEATTGVGTGSGFESTTQAFNIQWEGTT